MWSTRYVGSADRDGKSGSFARRSEVALIFPGLVPFCSIWLGSYLSIAGSAAESGRVYEEHKRVGGVNVP